MEVNVLNKELFIKRIVSSRENLNLTQIEVGQRIGINNKTLSGYERGVSEPDLQTLVQIANLYQVSIDWLLGNEQLDKLLYQRSEAANKLINAQKKHIESLEAMVQSLSVFKELCDNYSKI
jgi:transcriptional regulator with XRE-family HTH domain